MKKVILLSVSILLISLAYSFAEVPCKINYQGRLIKDNVPVDGTKKMVFSIYNDAVAVTPPLWTSGDVNITVHNGLFRYVLDLSSIDDWTAGETLYLEVKVETDILTPREELYAYPYAINSHLLEGETKEYFINTSAEAQTKQGNLNIMGNVGIGTTSPTEELHIWGNSGAIGIYIERDTFNKWWIANSGGILYIEPQDAEGDVSFRNLANQSVMYIDNSASKVGIGTLSPGEKLTVAGTIESTTGGIKFPDGTTQTTAVDPPKIYFAVGTTNISRSSTAWGDMPDMSITQTFPEGKVLVIYNSTHRMSLVSGKALQARIVIDGVQKIVGNLNVGSSSHQFELPGSIIWAGNISEGLHTVKIQWRVEGGTGYQNGTSWNRVLTVILGQ